MILLIDFSQLVISSMTNNATELKSSDAKNFAKHIVLTQLLNIRSEHRGETILCCDSVSYWRRNVYPYYKGQRKHEKAKSEIDWNFINEVMCEIKQDIRDNFPYKLFEVKDAEADDLIAVLCEYFQENELINSGIFNVSHEIVISSSDGDFQQLQIYKNVKQWNHTKGIWMKCDSPTDFLIEHICTGDSGDNVPNICTSDEWAKCRSENIKAPRAKSFMRDRLKYFYAKGIDASITTEERTNFERNEKLISFKFIPDNIKHKIIDVYKNLEIKGSSVKVLNYLQQHRMRLLMADYQKF